MSRIPEATAIVLTAAETAQAPQEGVRQDPECPGKYASDQLAGSGEGSDHRRAPQRRRRIESSDVDPFWEDHAGSKKAATGDDLSADPRRAVVARYGGEN